MKTEPCMHPPPDTLLELVLQRAEQLGEKLAFRYLRQGEVDGPVDELTYAQLARRGRVVGEALQREVRVGARALLLFPSGLDFVVAFLGAQLGGAIPVPVYPPDPSRLEKSMDRLRGIVADCSPEVVLTTAAIKELAQPLLLREPSLRGLPWIAIDDLPDSDGWVYPPITEDSLAFLQYTSGSTGAPKGVMVSHRNLLTNLSQIQEAARLGERSVGVFWLPHYHDMGLIGGLLQSLYSGYPLVVLSPLDFLQRPLRWLRAMSHFRGTASGAPNFAYDLCARKITEGEKAGLDLSAWEVTINGAEPVRAETLGALL
jgi:acyl-CoA synthetase (AMP-forming)/AMP-acid ligase II